jgi:hypothetical protein
LSAADGKFELNNKEINEGRILFQHISFHPLKKILKDEIDLGQIILQEKLTELSEVYAKAERPLVKISAGKLVYNADMIMKRSIASNAFDIIKELPGISENNDDIKLIGASSLTIIMDGIVSKIPQEQLLNILKSTPAIQIKDIEIMYNAPSKYNVHGAVINIITDKSITDEKKIQGEITGKYTQMHYPGGNVTGNLQYKNKNINLDFMLNLEKDKYWQEANIFSIHTVSDHKTAIDQNTLDFGDMNRIMSRISGDYIFNDKERISFSGYFSGKKTDGNNNTDSRYKESINYDMFSHNKIDEKEYQYNANINYSSKIGLRLGLDYTYYNDKDNNKYTDYKNDIIENDFFNNSKQEIQSLTFTSIYEGKFSQKYSWNVGANAGYNKFSTNVDYFFNQENLPVYDSTKRIDGLQNEYITTLFFESINEINDKLSFNISLQAEYFISKYNNNDIKKTLWNEWVLFPNTTLTYSISNRSLLQFVVSSNKNYPSFWAVNPQTTYVNSYMEITGNPFLKPSKRYDAQLIYLLDRKYTFLVFTSYRPNYFSQVPYQDEERMKIIYRYENLNYNHTLGAGAVIPIRIGDFWTSNFSVHGIRIEQRMDNFHGYSFSRNKYLIAVQANNSFTISKSKPNIKLQLNGNYQSPMIQGVYNIGDLYNLSSGIRWSFSDEAYFLIEYNNILKKMTPNPTTINWENQYNRRNVIEQNIFNVTFSWRFGNYKTKKFKSIDNARYGK